MENARAVAVASSGRGGARGSRDQVQLNAGLLWAIAGHFQRRSAWSGLERVLPLRRGPVEEPILLNLQVSARKLT